MTSKPHDTTSKSKLDADDSKHKSLGKYPAKSDPAKSGKRTPVPSGVRPDLAKAGPDGQGGDAGGVGNSI